MSLESLKGHDNICQLLHQLHTHLLEKLVTQNCSQASYNTSLNSQTSMDKMNRQFVFGIPNAINHVPKGNSPDANANGQRGVFGADFFPFVYTTYCPILLNVWTYSVGHDCIDNPVTLEYLTCTFIAAAQQRGFLHESRV